MPDVDARRPADPAVAWGANVLHPARESVVINVAAVMIRLYITGETYLKIATLWRSRAS
jgi:hypothetical protein